MKKLLSSILVYPDPQGFSLFRNLFFPIRHLHTAGNPSFCRKILTVKNIILLFSFLITITGFCQTINSFNEVQKSNTDHSSGTISGQVTTTDHQPAALVTVLIKGTDKITRTDEQGLFVLLHVKEGVQVVVVSMVGLKTMEKTVTIKKDEAVNLIIELSEDARQLKEVTVRSGRKLNQRTVSAGKVDIHPMDLPQSIAVVGQGQIKEQQAIRLSDVMKNVNGVYLSSTRGNAQESFSARGYSFGNTNLLKNGARINPGAMPEMSSLEKVEVLKGSAAILYGQVAPGGIVNMVTKQPKFKKGGEIGFRTGSYGLYKPYFDVYGPVNSSIALRLNGSFETANSFRDGVHSKRYYVNPSALFKIGNKTELIIEGDYLFHQFTPDFGIGSLDNTIIPRIPRSRYLGTPWQYTKTQQATITTSVNHQLSAAWKLNGSLSYQLYKRDYYATERIQAAANGDWTRTLGKVLTQEDYYTGQANLTGKLTTGSFEHTILAGVDADHYFTSNYDFSFPAIAGLPAGSYDKINILDLEKFVQRTDIPEAKRTRKRTAPVNRFGSYVQDLIKLSPQFNVLAGVRWSYVETKGIDSLNLNTVIRTTGTTRYDKAFSPRFGIVYKPTKSTSLFTSYANSFTINTGQDVEGNILAPSIIDQYELGIKNELLNGRLSANFTLYRIINNNLAQTAPFLSDGTANNNSNIKVLTGQTKSDGMELDLAAQPVKGLEVSGGYSYNFARYTKTNNAIGSYKTGERLVNNPAHTANATVNYSFYEGLVKGLRLSASVYYLGKRFGGWNNTVGQIQNYSRLVEVKGFTTIDLAASYTYKKLSLQARITNLTNTLNYYVHENYSINPIPPTQIAATVSYKF
jgi:iron complex outermembrane receptor protein